VLDNPRLLDEHERRARRDSLTGLRNHREFRETLAAAALTAVCRGTDAAFRIGGAEFALVFSEASRDEAAQVATRALAAIDRPDGSAGVSWGVAGIPEDGDTDDRLIAAADAAMYRLKGHPRAMVPPDHDPAGRRLAVASRLAAQLTMLGDVDSIASAVVDELHRAFGYYLAVVYRLEDHGVLRIVAEPGRWR
jgi:GGDEF domain-containing protein